MTQFFKIFAGVLACFWLSAYASSPKWEEDLKRHLRSVQTSSPFQVLKRLRLTTSMRNQSYLPLFGEPSPRMSVTTSLPSPTFYQLVAVTVRRLGLIETVSGSAFSEFIEWPRTIPSMFRRPFVNIVEFDRLNIDLAPQILSRNLSELSSAFGLLELNQSVVSATDTAMIFRLHSPSVVREKLLKYQIDCPQDNEDIHPILLDYFFLKHLEPLNISPKAHYVSPPSSLANIERRECLKLSLLRIDDITWRSCTRAHPTSTVRFLILDYAGKSLHSYMMATRTHRVEFGDAMRIAISSIEAIRILHEEGGVVHGDIHAGNICIRPESQFDAAFIDFGKAFLVADMMTDPIEQLREPFSWVHALFSPWDILGRAPGKRDDVFKILLTVALVMNGPSYTDYLTRLEANATSSYEWKQERNLFISPMYDFRAKIPKQATQVESMLLDILQAVRAIPMRSSRPPYEWIVSQLKKILTLVGDS